MDLASIGSSVRPVSSRISLLLLPLSATLCILLFLVTSTGDQVEVRWWVQAEVEAGVAQGEDGVPEYFGAGDFTPRLLWRSVSTNVMVLVGWLFRPTELRSTTLFDFFSLWEPSDPEGKFCRRVVDYCFRTRQNSPGCYNPEVRATSADILNFVEACRDVYADLGDEERDLLQPYRAAGVIPEAVLYRDDTPTSMEQELAREQAPPTADDEENSRRISREELVKVLSDSLQGSLLSDGTSSPPEDIVNALSGFNFVAVPTIPSDWAEVGRAVRLGQIVRFDSTPLLPPELFNMSMEQLAEIEGRAADQIPVFSSVCAPMSLRSYAAFGESHIRRGRGSSEGASSPGADSCQTINVNARRLPNLFSRLPDRLEKALGLEDEILRLEPYLWLGPVSSVNHYDENPSVYILLSGHADMILTQQSCTDFLGSDGSNSRRFSTDDPLLKVVPSHLIHLRPGDGIVIPSRSYHLVIAQYSNRIALNFFIQARWRGLELPKDSWQAREGGKELGLQHLALRQLFFRSLIRLYERTGKGIFFVVAKNELL